MVFVGSNQELLSPSDQGRKSDNFERFLHHKGFTDNVSVDIVGIRFANVVLSHSRCLDGVQHIRCNYRQQGIEHDYRRSVPSIQDQ